VINETLTLEFDGGSRGNPGPAAIGVVIRAADGTPLVTLGRPIGVATNNVAEYKALIAGLEKAIELGAKKILIRGDSELIIKQMRGEYRVKHPAMRPLHETAQALFRKFEQAKIEHNLRHKNELADKLANLAMDRRAEVTDADDDSPPSPEPQSDRRFTCSRCGCAIEVTRPSSSQSGRLRAFVCQCGTRMLPQRD
jgi:ribonuclease HI